MVDFMEVRAERALAEIHQVFNMSAQANHRPMVIYLDMVTQRALESQWKSILTSANMETPEGELNYIHGIPILRVFTEAYHLQIISSEMS